MATSGDFDVWVLPTSEHSQWFARLNWYLNWQMSKGLAHNRPEPSVELLRVLETNGIRYVPATNVDHSPLMVSSQGRLPAGKCVVLEYETGQLRGWLDRIFALVSTLKPKRMRVFLPKGITAKEAAALWHQADLEIEFSTDEDQAT